MSEATGPDVTRIGHKGKFHYEPDGPILDQAEAVRARSRAAYEKQHPDADMSGLIFTIKKVPD
jgi:hypothetical protein